jgi:hypothetical protein
VRDAPCHFLALPGPMDVLNHRPIGFGATISAPHMHAHAAENLLPSLVKADIPGGAILDVGSGSGYRECRVCHSCWILSLPLRLPSCSSRPRLTAKWYTTFHRTELHAVFLQVDDRLVHEPFDVVYPDHFGPRGQVVEYRSHFAVSLGRDEQEGKRNGVELGAVEGGVHIICGDGRLGELTCYCPGTLPLRSGSPENGGSFEGCAGLAYV